MKLLLKLFTAPIILVLSVIVWVCSAALYCLSAVSGLASSLTALLGTLVLLTTSVSSGMTLLLLAWIISPVGLPLLGAGIIGCVNRLRLRLWERVYG